MNNIYNIFKKNLSTIFRNWVYFVVLFVCPVVLILVAGFVLNSSSLDNVKIGIVDETSDFRLDFEGISSPGRIKNVIEYGSIDHCLNDLVSSRVNSCLHISYEGGSKKASVYLDNKFRVVEYYARQFILNNLVKEQTKVIQETSEKITSRIEVYSTFILDTKNELYNVESELDSQEKLLLDYRNRLLKIKTDFDKVYWSLKGIEPEINNIQNGLTGDLDSLRKAISDFRSKKQVFDFNVNSFKTFLFNRLSKADYEYASSNFDSILFTLNDLDRILYDLDGNIGSNSRLVKLVNDIGLIIPKLDLIKQTLDDLDRDLLVSIQGTQGNKDRVRRFIVRLDDAVNEIGGFSEDLDGKGIVVEFKKTFDIKEDPVLLAFPILVAIIITFTSLIISNMFILRQVNSPSHFRDLISPTSDVSFLIANYLVNLLFSLIQTIVLFFIGFVWLGFSIDVLPLFVLSIFLTSSIFICLGMALGYFVRSQGLSMLLTVFYVMLLLILSDVLAPTVLAGNFVKEVIGFSPFVVLNDLLVDGLLLGKSIFEVKFYVLAVSLVVSALIVYAAKKINRRRLLS